MKLTSLTKNQAIILTAYTGVNCMSNVDDFIEFMRDDFDPDFTLQDLDSRATEIRDFYSEEFFQILG
jgi:hypothetical protein